MSILTGDIISDLNLGSGDNCNSLTCDDRFHNIIVASPIPANIDFMKYYLAMKMKK